MYRTEQLYGYAVIIRLEDGKAKKVFNTDFLSPLKDDRVRYSRYGNYLEKR